MAYFPLGFTEQTHMIRRANVFWTADLDLPDHVRETMPVNDVADSTGVLCLAFYCDPIPGDLFEYRGHIWRVIERVFLAARYKTSDPRRVPELIVEYVGSVDKQPLESTLENDTRS